MVFDNHEQEISTRILDGCIKMKSHTMGEDNLKRNSLIKQSKNEVDGLKSTNTMAGSNTTDVVEVTNTMGNSSSTGAFASVAVQSVSSSDTAFMEGPRHDNRVIDDSLT